MNLKNFGSQILSFAIAAALVNVSYSPVYADFSDVTGDHWAKAYVNELVSRHILKGYDDNSFRPDKSLTRAEAVKIIIGASGVPLKNPKASSFSDVPLENAFSKFIETAKAEQFIKGYDDGSFKPNKAINRAEFIKIFLSSIAKVLENPVTSAKFEDVPLSDAFAKYIYSAKLQGIVGGFPDGSFKPYNLVTRAEASKMIYKFLKEKEDEGKYPNVRSEERVVWNLINESRREKGLPDLQLDRQLSEIARNHSKDLAENTRKTDHYGSDGSDPFDRLKAAQVSYEHAAENVGWGTFHSRDINDVLGAIHQAMISQPEGEHNNRANIYSTYYEFNKVGIGIHSDPETKEIRLTEVFVKN